MSCRRIGLQQVYRKVYVPVRKTRGFLIETMQRLKSGLLNPVRSIFDSSRTQVEAAPAPNMTLQFILEMSLAINCSCSVRRTQSDPDDVWICSIKSLNQGDEESNLITLCSGCYALLHDGRHSG